MSHISSDEKELPIIAAGRVVLSIGFVALGLANIGVWYFGREGLQLTQGVLQLSFATYLLAKNDLQLPESWDRPGVAIPTLGTAALASAVAFALGGIQAVWILFPVAFTFILVAMLCRIVYVRTHRERP
jgi:hypothetical protein